VPRPHPSDRPSWSNGSACPTLGLLTDQPPAGFGATPLLVLLAVLPPVLAAGFVLSGRALTGAAVLVGTALLAPGAALADLQLVHDVPLVSRPELLVQTSLAELAPAAGLWVLLAGHVVTAVAGALAVGKAGATPESTYAVEVDGGEDLVGRNRLDEPADPTATHGSGSRGPLGWTLFFCGVAVIGLLMAPFRSDNAYLLAHGVADSPPLALAGCLVVVAAVVFGGVYAGTAPRPEVTRGAVLGLLAGVAAVTVPNIVSGVAVPGLRPALGPYLALAPVLLLAIVVFVLPSLRPAALTTDSIPEYRSGREGRRVSGVRGAARGRQPIRRTTTDEVELTLGARGMHLATGVLGVLAGAAAFVGAFAAQLVLAPELTSLLASEGVAPPETFANRQFVPVAILLVLLGGALLTPLASVVRPAFVVSLGSVALVGAGTLDAALTASDVSDEVRLGAGFWFVIAALVLAAVAAVFAAIAGGVERDEVDLSAEIGTAADRKMLGPCVAAALLGVGAFGLPMIDAAGFTAPGIWTEFRPASWGLLAAVAVVAAACLVAVRARPVRAAALLLGAVAVVGVHLLELPLTGARVAEPSAGLGTWLSLACVVALLVGVLSALMNFATGREKAS